VSDYLGWVATAVFTASYFCTRAEALRRVQMVGSVMWIAYGVLIGASPVIVSNLLVLGAAAWTMTRPSERVIEPDHRRQAAAQTSLRQWEEHVS
jgi:Bacterial inner membrane protein